MNQIKLTKNRIEIILYSFFKGVNSISDEKVKAALNKLLEHFSVRLIEAPASHKLAYHNCFPGGLIDHSIRVYIIFQYLFKKFGKACTNDDMIIAALFHDIGKLGTVDQPYYIPNSSQWHKEKLGAMYEINSNISYMPHAQRSVQLLSHFEVPLSDDVFRAISIHDGMYVDCNRPYAMKEGMFALLLHMADRLATEQEKSEWLAIQ
ncbi:MAG: HD domain-containing protein [Spirochaetes bacterium]|nr:HD domain-containing protein [Spirochaetota bacterium]